MPPPRFIGLAKDSDQHVGRPRDPARAAAILDAVLELLAEHGYECLTIDAVCQRAGASKATVYRRWESKSELVSDALAGLRFDRDVVDTGTLSGDLDLLCVELTGESGRRLVAVMQGLATAIPRNPSLMTAFNEHFVAPRRAAMAQMFARAVARGEMPPGKDVDLLTSVAPALMMYQLLTEGAPQEPGLAHRVITEIVLPAATAPAAASIRAKR